MTGLPDPILLKRRDEIIFLNQALRSLLGIAPSATSQDLETALDRITPTEGSHTFRAVVSASAELGPDGKMFTLAKEDARVLSLKIQGVSISDETSANIMEYIITDVTAVQELQKAKAQERSFKILVATASHDIRSPLNVISGILEIIELKLKSDKSALEQLKVAKVAAKRTEMYLQGLSYLHQLETGKLQVDSTFFDLRAAVNEIIWEADVPAHKKGLTISVDVENAVPEFVCTDKRKYQMILHFLLRNAIKYTFSGGVTIGVQFNAVSEVLQTKVADTGIGIPPAMMPRLFKLFAKSTDDSHLNPQGIGLGLYLCKSLSTLLHGDLSISSVLDQGTTATFTVSHIMSSPSLPSETGGNDLVSEERKEVSCLPQFQPAQSRVLFDTMAIAQEDEPTKLPDKCGCPRVLIVDDDPFNAMILSSYLAPLQQKTVEASNGQAALEKIIIRSQGACCQGFRVVLMDINMPVMDGIEATKAIRKMVAEKQIPPVPIVAVTAAAQLENSSVCSEYRKLGFSAICI
ncbi:MAG: ATP-binding protein [Candidatus Pacebacteria bacterium]|nr:ATP-binding protein [Candidatus Paceibacterota bacterium]